MQSIKIFAIRVYSDYKRKSTLPGGLVVLLILFSLLNMARIFQTPPSAERSIDFRPLYLGQYLLQRGENPYRYELQIQTWKELAGREEMRLNSVPRFLLYPPWALVLFLIFAPLPFSVAVWIWYGALPFMLAVIIFGCLKCFLPAWSWVNAVEATLFALAFKGTIQAMTVGQPAFLCLALGFGSLAAYRVNRQWLAGLLLGLASLKISLAVPFVLFFVFRKRILVLVSAAGVGTTLSLVWFWLANNPLEVVTGYYRALSKVDSYSYRPDRAGYPLTYDLVNKTELGALLEFLFNGIAPYVSIIHLCLVGVIVMVCLKFLKGGRPTDLFLFLLVSLIALLTTHHFYYDCLILLPLYPLALHLSGEHRRLLLLILLPFVLPVNGLLGRISTPQIMDVLYFTTPMTVAALTMFLLWRVKAGEESLVKTPDR